MFLFPVISYTNNLLASLALQRRREATFHLLQVFPRRPPTHYDQQLSLYLTKSCLSVGQPQLYSEPKSSLNYAEILPQKTKANKHTNQQSNLGKGEPRPCAYTCGGPCQRPRDHVGAEGERRGGPAAGLRVPLLGACRRGQASTAWASNTISPALL